MPNKPVGLNAKTPNNIPKETAGAQDGPKKVETKLSAIPNIKAPTKVPGIEPKPPRTTMAKTLPIKKVQLGYNNG